MQSILRLPPPLPEHDVWDLVVAHHPETARVLVCVARTFFRSPLVRHYTDPLRGATDVADDIRRATMRVALRTGVALCSMTVKMVAHNRAEYDWIVSRRIFSAAVLYPAVNATLLEGLPRCRCRFDTRRRERCASPGITHYFSFQNRERLVGPENNKCGWVSARLRALRRLRGACIVLRASKQFVWDAFDDPDSRIFQDVAFLEQSLLFGGGFVRVEPRAPHPAMKRPRGGSLPEHNEMHAVHFETHE